MNNYHFKNLSVTLFLLISLFSFRDAIAYLEGDVDYHDYRLNEIYHLQNSNPSDINEHLPVLRQIAAECSSVDVLGVRPMIATWGILQGLSENSLKERKFLGIDLIQPDERELALAKKLSQENGIDFTFWKMNEMEIKRKEIEPVDMLFIDSLHTYCHLTYELQTFSPKVKKYICMHDTSDPYGSKDDEIYKGDYSEYPDSYDRSKKGLWPAVCDFLKGHPEWILSERLTNNHGLTILKRK